LKDSRGIQINQTSSSHMERIRIISLLPDLKMLDILEIRIMFHNNFNLNKFMGLMDLLELVKVPLPHNNQNNLEHIPLKSLNLEVLKVVSEADVIITLKVFKCLQFKSMVIESTIT